MEKRKKTAREKPLQQVSEKELELNIEDIYPKDKGLGFFFPLNTFPDPHLLISHI